MKEAISLIGAADMTMNIMTFSNSEDGTTKFGEETVNLKADEADFLHTSLLMSPSNTCKRYFFFELPVGYSSENDFSARKQICVLLSGRLELRAGAADKREITVGDVIRLEDTDFNSPSRSIRVLGNEPAHIFIVQLE